MSIFSSTASRIAEEQEKLRQQQLALEAYEKAIAFASQEVPGVVEILQEVHNTLSPYSEEHSEFVKMILEAVGGIPETLQTANDSDDSDDSNNKKEEETKRNPLTIILGKREIGYYHSGIVGFEFFIGFERRNAKNGGNAATIWKKFLEESYSGLRCTVIKNWEDSKIDLSTYPWLVQCQGGNFDICNEVSKLDFSVLPEEAIDKESFSGEESKLVEPEKLSEKLGEKTGEESTKTEEKIELDTLSGTAPIEEGQKFAEPPTVRVSEEGQALIEEARQKVAAKQAEADKTNVKTPVPPSIIRVPPSIISGEQPVDIPF